MKQITQPSGRYYLLDEGSYAPSITTIQGKCYPKPAHLQEWVGKVGNEEAGRVLKEAGEEGTVVHESIDKMTYGQKIRTAGLTEKQKRCLTALIEWWEFEQPQKIASEYFVWGQHEVTIDGIIQQLLFAGSVDFKCRIRSDSYQNIWIIDWKTSNSIQAYFKSQISAYMFADTQRQLASGGKDIPTKGAVLQLGNSTKRGWSWSEVDYPKDVRTFLLCLELFHHLNPNAKPQDEIIYPEYFELPNRQLS